MTKLTLKAFVPSLFLWGKTTNCRFAYRGALHLLLGLLLIHNVLALALALAQEQESKREVILPGTAKGLVLSALSDQSATEHETVPPSYRDCEVADLRIESRNLEDAQDACAAGLAVSEFFRGVGLMKSAPVTLTIVDHMPSEHGDNVMGYFMPENMQIRILSFAASRDRGNWLGHPMDRLVYKSLAAHELAHALGWLNTSGGTLSLRAREYVAYVVMYATMEPNHRSAILAEMQGEGFTSDEQISDAYYYFGPLQFGVQAYRHYLRPENGPRFLRAILRGEVLPIVYSYGLHASEQAECGSAPAGPSVGKATCHASYRQHN